MTEMLQTVLRVLVGLAIILVVLALFGFPPSEAGEALGNAFNMVGDFFRGVSSTN